MSSSMSGIKAGRAFVVIDAVDKTGAILNQIAGNFKRIGSTLMNLGGKSLFGGIAAMTPVATSLSMLTAFDDAMKRVEARAAGTTAELKTLREQALYLGRTTSFTSTEVADLMSELASAGYARSEINKMVESVLALSRVSNSGPLDTRQAAELTAATLRIFNMEAGQANKVADLLATAMTNARFPFEDLQTAITYAGKAAYEFKVPIEDAMAVITHLKRTGMDASSVGSAFRNMLLEMSESRGAKKFNKMLGELTGKNVVFRDISGNLKPLPDILFKVGEAITDLGTAEQGDLLQLLFGKRAFLPAASLMKGKNPFLEMVNLMQESSGRAQRIMDLMDSGIGGAWRRFTSAVEGAALSLGETLMPAMIDLSKHFERILDDLTTWMNTNSQAVIGVVLLGASLIPLGVSLLTAGVSFKILASALGITAAVATGSAMAMRILGIQVIFAQTALLGLELTTIAVKGAILLMSAMVVPALLTVINTVYKLGRVLLLLGAAESLFVSDTIIPRLIGSLVGLYRAFWAVAAASEVVMSFIFSRQIFGLLTAGAWGAAFGVLALKEAMLNFYTTAGFTKIMLSAWRGLATVLTFAAGLLTTKVAAIVAVMGVLGYLIYSNRKTIFDVINKVIKDGSAGINYFIGRAIQLFHTLYADITKVGSGISRALTLGETAVAWEIGVAGLELIWMDLMSFMMDQWDTLTNYMKIEWPALSSFFKQLADDAGWVAQKNLEAWEAIKEIWEFMSTGKIDPGDPEGMPKANATGKPGDPDYDPNYNPLTDPFNKSGDQIARERMAANQRKLIEELEAQLDYKQRNKEYENAWKEIYEATKLEEKQKSLAALTASRPGLADAISTAEMAKPATVGEIKASNALTTDLDSLKQIWEIRMQEQFGKAQELQERLLETNKESLEELRDISGKLED